MCFYVCMMCVLFSVTYKAITIITMIKQQTKQGEERRED